MKLNLKKPIVFFDLEATGMSVTTDRIVEYAFLKINTDGTEETLTARLHPGMPIPIESSLIHGIYDEDVKDKPLFKQVAKEIFDFIGASDLGGYNLLMFDIPMLIEEFYRAKLEFDISKRNIIDSQKIFYLMQPRTLTAAYKYYCDKNLKDAHSAEADTRATYEVLLGQLAMHQNQEIEDKSGKKTTPILNDMEHIHKATVGNIADLAGRIIFNEKGVEVFNFGKFKGQPVADVLQKERGYYDWMMNGDFPQYTKKVLTQIKLRSAKFNN
jgi:DNA polymerase III subunit epsilon